jgi:hypothetical protein
VTRATTSLPQNETESYLFDNWDFPLKPRDIATDLGLPPGSVMN